MINNRSIKRLKKYLAENRTLKTEYGGIHGQKGGTKIQNTTA